jgi:hypothetical protein
VLSQAQLQIISDPGVNLVWMGQRLQRVNIMEIIHRQSPPSLRKAELWRAAFDFVSGHHFCVEAEKLACQP